MAGPRTLRDPQSRMELKNMAPATADLLRTHPLVEEILDGHRDHAAGDERGWASHRGHAYPVLNLARVLVPDATTATTSWRLPQPFMTSTCSAR